MVAFINPVKMVEELAMLCAMMILLMFLFKYRDRVLLALTGDDHIHGGFLDVVWWTLRCGGSCTGDWTRDVTNHCICLPQRCRGCNIIKELGRILGFASKNVEIKNIVVGDLPFQSRGDFYLTVQCASNPDQVTSLAEDKDPKVVHFPEVLTLRIRNSPLEEGVKITVRELNILGSQDLCEVKLSAMNVVDWSDDADEMRTKRFSMKPVDGGLELETPPWILVEFGKPHDPRHLDLLRGNPDIVRTTMPGAQETKDMGFSEFKTEFNLLDAGGHIINEPDEADLAGIRMLRKCLVWTLGVFNCVVFFCIGVFSLFRFYLWSCYTQYTNVAMAVMHNMKFPASLAALHDLAESCDEETMGTGLLPGIPCRPSNDQITQVSHNLPPGQPEPGAGRLLIHRYAGVEVKGLSCAMGGPMSGLREYVAHLGNSNTTHSFASIASNTHSFATSYMNSDRTNHTEAEGAGVCEVRNAVAPFDSIIYITMGLMIMSTCCCRLTGNSMIRAEKNRRQAKRAAKTAAALKGRDGIATPQETQGLLTGWRK